MKAGEQGHRDSSKSPGEVSPLRVLSCAVDLSRSEDEVVKHFNSMMFPVQFWGFQRDWEAAPHPGESLLEYSNKTVAAVSLDEPGSLRKASVRTCSLLWALDDEEELGKCVRKPRGAAEARVQGNWDGGRGSQRPKWLWFPFDKFEIRVTILEEFEADEKYYWVFLL